MTPSVPAPQAPSDAPATPPRPPAGGRAGAFDVPPWRIWTVPLAVVVGGAFGALATILVAVAAHAGGGSSLSHPAPVVNIAGSVLSDLAFVAASLYFARLHGRPRAADFGFRRAPPRLAGAAFVIGGVSYYVLTYAYGAILNLHGSEKLPKELGAGKSTAAAVAVTAFVCVIAPIAEELFFRGFIFGALRRWRIVVGGRDAGTVLAAVVTATLFGLAHIGSAPAKYLVPLALLGFVLCLVRWRTASLYPCMALHSFNNSLAIGVQFHWHAGEILALMAGSLLVIAGVTGPLSSRAAPLAS